MVSKDRHQAEKIPSIWLGNKLDYVQRKITGIHPGAILDFRLDASEELFPTHQNCSLKLLIVV